MVNAEKCNSKLEKWRQDRNQLGTPGEAKSLLRGALFFSYVQ